MAKTDPVPNRLFWQARRRVNLTRGQLADTANQEPAMDGCEHELMTENFIGRIEQGRIGGNMCAQRLAALCARLGVAEPSDIGLLAGRRHPTDSAPARPRRRPDATDTADEVDTTEQQPAAPQTSQGIAEDRSARDELAPCTSDMNSLASGPVQNWTGVEAAALRAAHRMSIRAYAEHLGLATASVSNWERKGKSVQLRTETKQILDTDLQRATEQVRERFFAALANRSESSKLRNEEPETFAEPVGREWPIPPGPEGIAEAWVALGAHLAEGRKAAGYTQAQFAKMLLVSRSTIANVEIGRQRVARSFWVNCDAIFDGDGLLVDAYDQISRETGNRRADATTRRRREIVSTVSSDTKRLGIAPTIGSALSGLDSDFESTLGPLERLAILTDSVFTDSKIDQGEKFMHEVINVYEVVGPREVVPRLMRQRARLNSALSGFERPRHKEAIYRQTARMAGMLAYAAVNLGKFATAQAYCAEAFGLADFVEDRELCAWVRGTESFCSYYQGDYRRAAELAREGRELANGGPQSIRLLINGEARALAKLGDSDGTDRAVEQALELSAQFGKPDGMSPCLSFNAYSNARTISNAVTAYTSLGLRGKVEGFLKELTPTVDLSASVWSKSLVRLDFAKVLIASKVPEPEEAADLAVRALTISAERPIASILIRAREVYVSARPWRHLEAVRRLGDVLTECESR